MKGLSKDDSVDLTTTDNRRRPNSTYLRDCYTQSRAGAESELILYPDPVHRYWLFLLRNVRIARCHTP